MKCRIPAASLLSGAGADSFLTSTSQVKKLCSLGFSDEARCHEALRQSGGEVRGALALLQRPLLEPFHERIWSDKPEPAVDIHHPDKQVRPSEDSGPEAESRHWNFSLVSRSSSSHILCFQKQDDKRDSDSEEVLITPLLLVL